MYPSDLTDDEWALLKPLFPDPGYDIPKNGRPRDWSYRLILNAIFYISKSGCQWRMLPSDFPPWSTVYTYFRKWKIDGTWKDAFSEPCLNLQAELLQKISQVILSDFV